MKYVVAQAIGNAAHRLLLGRGKEVDVEYKSRLFRLAHDLAASSVGLRQEIYEYWHGGDPNRNRINLLRSFDQKEMKGRIRELLRHALPHGEAQ